MLQRTYFKFRTSRLYLNFKCFGTSSLRTHFLDTTLLSFRDFFGYILIAVTRSSKLWYAHSKHCFYHFETWRFVSFQSKRPIYFASNNIIKIFSQQNAPLKYVFRFLWEILILNIYTRFWCDLRIIITLIAYDSSHVNHNAFQIP